MSFKRLIGKLIERVLPYSIVVFLKNQIWLVLIPYEKKSVISDLFPFKINEQWDTQFELLNLPALLNPENLNVQNNVRFIFFDENGGVIHEHILQNSGCQRNTLNIKDLLGQHSKSGYGTFACFHEYYGNEEQLYGGFLAERGYTGYENKAISNTKGYVHGNLDAIALNSSNELMCLGRYSKLSKYEFRLQHELTGEAIYELGFVNSSNKSQRLTIKFVSQGEEEENIVFEIPSRGIRWYKKELDENDKGRVIIVSRLNLARPVIFRHQKKSFDVFHG